MAALKTLLCCGQGYGEEYCLYRTREDHPLLYQQELTAKELNWFVSPESITRCSAKVRYRSEDEECEILHTGEQDKVRVRFASPVKAITPGQTIAFYDGERCLGRGHRSVYDSTFGIVAATFSACSS